MLREVTESIGDRLFFEDGSRTYTGELSLTGEYTETCTNVTVLIEVSGNFLLFLFFNSIFFRIQLSI